MESSLVLHPAARVLDVEGQSGASSELRLTSDLLSLLKPITTSMVKLLVSQQRLSPHCLINTVLVVVPR